MPVTVPQSSSVPAAQLYAQHAAPLHAAVQAAVRTSQSNVDDACAWAWAQLVAAPPARRPFQWLLTVALREAWRLDAADRRAVSLDQLDEHAPAPRRAGDDSQRIYAREALQRIATLPARQRVMFGYHVAGFDYGEIARLTGATRRTVDRQLDRARQSIRWPAH